MEKKETNRKKTGLLVALVLCCFLAIGGGVMAWFSAQASVKNTFTAGTGITDPEINPDPTDPTKPDKDDRNKNTDGKITETNWEKNSPITPGASVPKNPNVGIGKGSASAYVFVEVENNVGNGTYFILKDGWKPVADAVTKYDGTNYGWASVHETDQNAKDKAYTGGLFMYVGKTQDMAILSPLGEPVGTKTDAYTGEVFDRVYAGSKAELTQPGAMDVKAYLAAASNSKEDITTQAAKEEILAAAKKWTTTNNQ